MDKHGDQPLIGVEEGLARVRGNKAIYIRMLGLFLKSDQFHVMEELLSQGNFEKASEAAHGIKGMTGNLSLNRVFFLSSDLMTQLRQGPPDEETLAAYRQALTDTRNKVQELLAEWENAGSI